jgi:NADPH2:quinone reductase
MYNLQREEEKMMKSMMLSTFGGPDVFVLKEVPNPTAKPNQLIIEVKATSVNPADTKVRSGLSGKFVPTSSIIQGDVAGIVSEVGEEVTEFSVGDEVYACGGGFLAYPGALAEYMLVDASFVALKPKSLSMEEAAALPLVAITAWEGLVDKAKIQKGQKVLVHAATGGVGHIAIQLAKYFGADVYATASGIEKIKIAQELGATEGINYRESSVEEYKDKYTNGKGFDIVFDTIGKENLSKSFKAVKANGHVVCIQTNSVQDLTEIHGKGASLHAIMMLLPLVTGEGRSHQGYILRKISEIVDNGMLKPLIDDRIFPFSEVSLAHERQESGQQIGKVVLYNDLY